MKKSILISVGILATAALQVQASAGLSSYDRQIVASCMVLEAGCDGSEGMQAVLNVILNRADGYLYRMVPETVRHGAFSSMSAIWGRSTPNYSSIIRRAQNQRNAYAEALRLISVMENGNLWDNTYGATHYHASSMVPYWAGDMSYTTTIGGHHFYRDADRVASL